VDCLPLPELERAALAAAEDAAGLLRSVERARAWREGVLAVLAGPVNAGKSSLMNALVGRRRALVSEVPGTTRDYLEELLDLDGLTVRLVDTAGLRECGPGKAGELVCPVEAQGQDLAREFMARAEAVLYVLDSARPLAPEDRAALALLPPARSLVVLNKCDLPAQDAGLVAELQALGLTPVLVSALTGEGLDGLARTLRGLLLRGNAEPDADEVAPNARQAALLDRARGELLALAEDARAGLPYDILGVRLEAACRRLAEITGEIAPDEVLDAIFSQFCIGK